MIRAGIIGSTGYAGGELVRILLGHKDVEIKWYGSRSYIDKKYASVYQNMFQLVDDVCKDDNMEQLAKEVAHNAGAMGVLVLSGETTLDVADKADPQPHITADSIEVLGELIREANR